MKFVVLIANLLLIIGTCEFLLVNKMPWFFSFLATIPVLVVVPLSSRWLCRN
jgi:hypothetical protein